MGTPNPFLGIIFHWLGGLASGSFYVPYRGVKKWAWETYWLVGGFFSWIIAPWILAFLLNKGLIPSLQAQTISTLWWTYFWGSMWGLGGLTFGLTMRYLGMSLGMAVALSYCSFFGTVMPPSFEGIQQAMKEGHGFLSAIGFAFTKGPLVIKLSTHGGHYVLLGIIVCLIGIITAGVAGMSKEREMPEEEKKKSIKEFNFIKGMLVATFSGIMSASFAYGLTAGIPIAEASIKAGTDSIWSGLPKLVVVLAGGFTTNFIWCVMLNIKNKTGYEYFSATKRLNPRWGIALKEWKGASKRTHALITVGLLLLVASTIIIGYGNYLDTLKPVAAAVAEGTK
ncbi:MAG: rhamnose/proton symporter RhaT [Candidatus Sumerlaeota bacterium]|nr:rhamnose/proton symporter RhaT [Candidatus Sumerlaeota bacterium]